MSLVFAASEYRQFLKSWLDTQESSRGLLSKWAAAMKCQNSHLTRVLKGEVQLTMDQAHALASHLQLTQDETSYFMKLVEWERASFPAYRAKLKEEIKLLKSQQEDLSQRFREPTMGSLEKEMAYYSSWHHSAIHIATTIPAFRTIASIARRLSLDEAFVRQALNQLEAFGLVKRTGDQWKPTLDFLHLPKSSPMNAIQHGNWRQRAVLRSQDLNSDGLHYTVVQSVSESDRERIKKILYESIDRYRSIADKSKEEELTCFSCDFFKV